MNSHLTAKFRKLFANLPVSVQETAKKNYVLWKNNPGHPGLEFKKVNPALPIYSVRIGQDWRALGQREGDDIVWFWIGSHADYDKLLSQLG